MRISDWSSDVCSSDLSSIDVRAIRFAHDERVLIAFDLAPSVAKQFLYDFQWRRAIALRDGRNPIGVPYPAVFAIYSLRDLGTGFERRLELPIGDILEIGRESFRERG